ncbi:MAG: GNAT family N-acetyltransferase, partial [Chitinophagaceae bacterium]
MITIQVDTYSDSYKQPIIDLILDIQRNEFGVAITLEDQPDLENIPSFYQKNDGNFWVAVVENTVAGTIALLDIGNARGALRKMFVHKD